MPSNAAFIVLEGSETHSAPVTLSIAVQRSDEGNPAKIRVRDSDELVEIVGTGKVAPHETQRQRLMSTLFT